MKIPTLDIVASAVASVFALSTGALLLVVVLSAYGIIFSTGNGGADALGLAGRGGAILFLVVLGTPLLVVSVISGLCVRRMWSRVQCVGQACLRACTILKQSHSDVWSTHVAAGLLLDAILLTLVLFAGWGLIEIM
jgi:hypothetical protein